MLWGFYGNPFFWIISVIAAVWVIVDVLKHQTKMEQNQKIIWIVCAILFTVITAIVYYFVVKQK